MLDQFKPPTDNLYKFIALSGLVLLLAAGWAHLRVDLELLKLDRDFETVISAMDKEDRLHLAAEFRKYAEESRKSDVHDRDEILERVRSIWMSHPSSYEDRVKELAEILSAHDKLTHDNYPDRILLRIAMIVGALITICGFGLWYFKVQRPLDEILQAQVHESRAKRTDASN